MRNFKEDAPEIFNMMGEFYQLMQMSHDQNDIANYKPFLGQDSVAQKFVAKYENNEEMPEWARRLAWEMVYALLKATRDADKGTEGILDGEEN